MNHNNSSFNETHEFLLFPKKPSDLSFYNQTITKLDVTISFALSFASQIKKKRNSTIEGIEINDFKCFQKISNILQDTRNPFQAFISSNSRKKSMVKILGEIIII